jgi:hypothetical protein
MPDKIKLSDVKTYRALGVVIEHLRRGHDVTL